LDGVEFNSDPTFLLKRVIVEDLIHRHLTRRDPSSSFQEAISQCGFPVVNVRNDAEVAEVLHKNASYGVTELRSYVKTVVIPAQAGIIHIRPFALSPFRPFALSPFTTASVACMVLISPRTIIRETGQKSIVIDAEFALKANEQGGVT